MDLRETAQMALEALDSDNPDIQLRAATHLRAALAQPEQEPVAWMHDSHVGFNVPLYTAPPQREWQSLTDDDFIGLTTPQIFAMKFAEAKLREKNFDRPS